MDSAEKKSVKNDEIFPNIRNKAGQVVYGSGIPRSFFAKQLEDGNVRNYAIRPQEFPSTPSVKLKVNKKTLNRQLTTVMPLTPELQTQNPVYGMNQPILIPNQANLMQLQPNIVPNLPNFMPHPSYDPNYANPASFDSQMNPIGEQLYVNTNMYSQNQPQPEKQTYSPSDTYIDTSHEETQDQGVPLAALREGSESPDFLSSGQKRLSAFKRLGPLTESKKPKLTINLTLNKDEAVREVVDDTQESNKEPYIPFHLRPNVTTSTDDTVMKYLVHWPWKKKYSCRKRVTAKSSKTVMLMEYEQIVDYFRKDSLYFKVHITGYPKTWNKEKLLNVLLDALKGKSFIPCFIDFTDTDCQFLVIRSLSALSAICYKLNYIIKTDDCTLIITISEIGLNLNHLDFLPKLILTKRLTMAYDNERKLNLSAFTLGEEVSHFIYFPLHRHINQTELVRIQSRIAWDYLTDLDLSHNNLSTIDGFDLSQTCPRLKHLNLSYNCIESITILLKIRSLALNSIKLEGNPLCHDYIDSELYVKVLRMIFTSLKEIDGIDILLQGVLPKFERNFCPEECSEIVSKFLETFFPLMDSSVEDRPSMENLYDEDATLTVTYKYKLRYCSVFRYFRNLFLRSRVLDEGDIDSITGSANICKHFTRWPTMKHDPYSFTVDVMWYNETSIILRISGILRLTGETLADDEELLAFTRTFVLRQFNNIEYKIHNEMIYWENPTEECANNAFKVTTLKSKRLSLKLESAPDDDLKEKLTAVFMKLTSLPKAESARCLDLKDWNFKNALQLFYKLLKVDNLEYLQKR